jgi:hypothetical protein
LSIDSAKLTGSQFIFQGTVGVHAIDTDHVSVLAAHIGRLADTEETEMRAQFGEQGGTLQ